MNTKIWLVAILVIVAALSSACAEPAGPGTRETESAEEVKARTGTAEINCEVGKEPWRSPGPPKRGGTLVIAIGPPNNLETGGFQTYNGLLQNRKCFPNDTEIAPSLAKSWQVSSDGLTWTLKLRENVKWHNRAPMNGRQFTSADVGWMIDWQKEKGTSDRIWWQHVNHSEPDPHTVVLRLTRPDPDFLGKLGAGSNIMKPREIWEQDGDFKKRAVGTGAFMIKDFNPGSHTNQERNPDYYEMGADGRPLPYVDELHQPAFGDVTAELAAMRAGQLDHPGVFGFRPDHAAALRQSNPKLQAYELIPPITASIWFDPKVPPWNDVRVRRAVMLATDREGLITSYRGGVVHSGFVPAYFSDVAWPEEKVKEKFKYDPEGAKRLLAESGFNFGGRPRQLVTNGQYAQEAEVVQELLAKVGINTEVVVDSNRSWLPALMFKYELGWGTMGGPAAEFVAYYLCETMVTGNGDTQLSDSEVDRMCQAQERELDPAKRKQIWVQIQDRLYELMPKVPTLSTLYYQFVSCRLKNYKRMHLGRGPSGPVEAWIDPTGC